MKSKQLCLKKLRSFNRREAVVNCLISLQEGTANVFRSLRRNVLAVAFIIASIADVHVYVKQFRAIKDLKAQNQALTEEIQAIKLENEFFKDVNALEFTK